MTSIPSNERKTAIISSSLDDK
jgi:hypothetical protein